MNNQEYNELRSIEEVIEYNIKVGESKGNLTGAQSVLRGFLGGVFIALGCIAYLIIKHKTVDPGMGLFLGSISFSLGLILVVLLGGHLFTGNCILIIAALKKKITFGQYFKNMSLVLLGNLLGCLFMVYLIHASGLYEYQHAVETVTRIAEFKMESNFSQAFLLGIACNIIVLLIIMGTTAAKSSTGKVVISVIGIIVFVISGYQHIVANMYLIPAGIFEGSHIDIADVLLNNFLPVTLGNFVGGAVLISGIYYYAFVKKSQQ